MPRTATKVGREVIGSPGGFHMLPPKNQVDKKPLRIQKYRGRLRKQVHKPHLPQLHSTAHKHTSGLPLLPREFSGLRRLGPALVWPSFIQRSPGGHLDVYLVVR